MLVASGRLTQEGGRLVAAGRPLERRRPRRPRGAADAPRAGRGAPRSACRRPTARSSRTRPCSARRSPSRRWRRSRARRPQPLEPRLDLLVRREILTVETDPRAPTRGQHAFVQALVREVAYGTLSKRERRERHLAAARYLESLGDDELAGVVASHFVAAYRAAPDGPAGEAVAAQARVSLLATADRAESLGALGQAIDALTSALEVTRDPRDHARLLERTGLLQVFMSATTRAQQNLAAAVAEYEALGDQIGVIRAVARRCAGLPVRGADRHRDRGRAAGPGGRRGARDRARPHRQPTIDREEGETAALFAEAIGRIAFRNNEMEEAIRWCDRALALAEPLRLDEIVAMAFVTKGTALQYTATGARASHCSRARSSTRGRTASMSPLSGAATTWPRGRSRPTRAGRSNGRARGWR